VTVCLIVSIVVIAILLVLLMIPMSGTGTMSGFARMTKSSKKSHRNPPRSVNNRRVRAGLGAGAVRSPSAVKHHAPQLNPPAPLPAAQLMAPTTMPRIDPSLGMMQSSNASDSEMNESSTEAGGVSASEYSDNSYAMDPGMMTASSSTDIQGVETFMPMMSDGVGSSDGPVDPSTGLPLFTTGKLVRSQMLGGHGAGSFLRQQQDPLSGYKRLGKNMCGAQNARRDLASRRVQFNAARLADPEGDPVLFNTSEFMYS
jgi:hypothetical protein